LCPRLAKWCGVQVISQEPLYYFKEVVLQIIEHRKKTGQTRNDFLQFMMDTTKEDAQEQKEDIRNGRDYVKDKSNKNISNKGLTLDEAVAQSVSFFIAGYDTMASTVSFVTYLLALHPEIQNRTFEEIREVLQETKGELTYEALQEMKYLDNVICESMRLYPAVPRLERTATADCTLGDTDFLPEERAKLDPYSYIPFGDGPRYCLGMKYALMQVKVCIVCVVANFKILRCPETKVPLEFHYGPGLMIPKKMLLKFEERSDKIELK
ncbi:Cytochrome P450 3A8, partial [Araneus ventricosus]